MLLNKKDAIKFLGITEKNFNNYSNFSNEIVGQKVKGRWMFLKEDLEKWLLLKNSRTLFLDRAEYERCFEFAIKMAYGGLSLHGIRGERTEVQAADDIILGILAEYAVKKFFMNNFNCKIYLDEEVHPTEITPQDVDFVEIEGLKRKPRLRIGIKASKLKSGFLVLGSKEVDLESRVSDVYIFVRVGLPGDHLFRILRDHSFFAKVKNFLDSHDEFKKIEKLEKIPVWICGYTYKEDLDKVNEIPGQPFDNGYRYVKSVAKLKNSDDEWKKLIDLL